MESVIHAQHPRDTNDLFHRVVRAPEDAGAEEQSLDVVAPVEVEREADDFLGSEAGAPHVARPAVDAVQAIVLAEVREEDLEQADTAAVRRVAVTDPHPLRGSDPRAVSALSTLRAGAGARRIVLRRVGQHGQLVLDIHHHPYARIDTENLHRWHRQTSEAARIRVREFGRENAFVVAHPEMRPTRAHHPRAQPPPERAAHTANGPVVAVCRAPGMPPAPHA